METQTFPPPRDDVLISDGMFFAHLFYLHGFLLSRFHGPAFRSAYKNITPDVFRKTYIALPVYFVLRQGLEQGSFGSNMKDLASRIKIVGMVYPNMPDPDIAPILLREWSGATAAELDHLLFGRFWEQGVFEKVFENGADVESWFNNFLRQTMEYTQKCHDRSCVFGEP